MALTRPVAASRAAVRLAGIAAALMLAAGPAPAADGDVIRAHGISPFGALKYAADFPHLDYVNPDAPKGGEISLWAFGGFDSMNPYTIRGRAAAGASLPYESLLGEVADEHSASYCLLCESMEYPPGREWVIFHIRPEARFSDGTPVTAEDVLFSYETFLTKGLSDFRLVLSQQVEKAEILGPLSIRFTFRAEAPKRDLPATVGGLPIFSKADFTARNIDFEASTLEPFLGSGPYVLDSMRVGQTVTYRRNPDYWGKDLPLMRGRANFDRIRIEYYADYDAAFEGFKGGSYTFRTEARATLWATGYDFPALRAGHVVKRALPDGTIASGQSFIFNLRRPQFQDPRVREAIALMFNFEWSNVALFNGQYKRIHSFWENSELAATGTPSAEEAAILRPLVDEGLLPASILTDEAVMAPASWSRDRDREGQVQLDRPNLRRASQLLDEAGWTVGADGLRRNAAGQTLRAEFLNDSPSFDRIINPFVENLRQLGVDAANARVDNAQLVNRKRSHDFDIVTHQFPMAYVPGASLKQYFASQSADDSAFNLMGLRSPAIDRLIEVVLAADTEEKVLHATRALDRALRAERFWIPQWFKAEHWVAYVDMYEHPDPLPPYSLGHTDFWWWNADKAAALRAAGVIR
jgi:microcin C transport system substrate-binding protein